MSLKNGRSQKNRPSAAAILHIKFPCLGDGCPLFLYYSMLKINILFVGKPANTWLKEALSTYEHRLRGKVLLSWVRLRSDQALIAETEKLAEYNCLDPHGSLVTSEELAKFFRTSLRRNLVIGGHEGLPESVKKKATSLISLSKLTFPHELARLILTEQIYRSIEIQKGSSYHK